MKKYIPKLVEGTDDQYKIYTDNRGTMLCGDQMGEEFVKLHMVWDAIERCEGDIDYLKSMLPKDSFKEEPTPNTASSEPVREERDNVATGGKKESE